MEGLGAALKVDRIIKKMADIPTNYIETTFGQQGYNKIGKDEEVLR